MGPLCGLMIQIWFALNIFADVHFKKGEVIVGKEKLTVEFATTTEEQMRGLMFRRELKSGGMIFIFKEEKPQKFWMKNTFIPLDIGFFDKNLQLIDIQSMEPVRSEIEQPKTYDSAKPAQYVLEVPRDWFKNHGISVGAKLQLKASSRLTSSEKSRTK